MTIPRSSLRGFLSQAKTGLRQAIAQRQPITLVIGNESADLDSITSSILYAFVTSQAAKKTPFGKLCVPITNIPRADLALRPELAPICHAANIQNDHLITLDELPPLSTIESSLPPAQTKWILTDHNALQGRLGEIYSDRVVGCIDHHDDEHKIPVPTAGNAPTDAVPPRIIKKAGSCTSLVTNYIHEDWSRLSGLTSSASGSTQSQGDGLANDEAVSALWDAQVALFAMGSVLIDTNGMRDEHKVTAHDRLAVEVLMARIEACAKVGKDFDGGQFFGKVKDAKGHLDGLMVSDVLRKDYKMWVEGDVRLGMSSVVKPLAWIEEKVQQEAEGGDGEIVDACRTFAEERSLGMFAVMTAYTGQGGEFERELMVLGISDAGKAALKAFADSATSQLDLAARGQSEDGGVSYRIWKQGNVSASRKQVGPMLRSAIGGS